MVARVVIQKRFSRFANTLFLVCFIVLCQSTAAEDSGVEIAQSELSPKQAAENEPIRAWTRADDDIIAPIWLGDEDKGTLYTPLWRGALPGIEEMVYTPPDHDCRKGKATVRVDWDSNANTVRFIIKGHNMVKGPSIHRTEGVDYWTNEFHPNPKDFDNGAYRLWILQASTSSVEKLWYSNTNLLLKETEFTSATQPTGTIEITFPKFLITGSKQMNPDNNGTFVHEFTNRYDVFTNEGGLFAGDWVTFAPLDLCQAAPFQPAISQLRPVASPWQAVSEAQSFRSYLRAGLAFDLHAEEKADPTVLDGNLSYVYSGVSAFSNHPGMQGGVPNGWHMMLSAAILNVTPPIEKVRGGNGVGCQPYVNEPRPFAPRYCELPH